MPHGFSAQSKIKGIVHVYSALIFDSEYSYSQMVFLVRDIAVQCAVVRHHFSCRARSVQQVQLPVYPFGKSHMCHIEPLDGCDKGYYIAVAYVACHEAVA